MVAQKDNELKDKIIKDLLITGFPLEVSTSNILSKDGWRVETSPLYVDPDTKETRELDIYAIKIYNKEPRDSLLNNISIFSHLIIQCKKSNKPWVFFDNAGDDPYWLGFYSLKCDNSDFMPNLCSKGELIDFKNHRYKNIKRYKSFHVSFNEPNQTSPIYEALITACKALEYEKSKYSSGNTAHFFTPIIVLDGTLWSASLSKTSRIKLKQVNKLVVKFDYIFGDDKKPNKYMYQFIEIITQKEFQKHIKTIGTDNNELLRGWINFLNLESIENINQADKK